MSQLTACEQVVFEDDSFVVGPSDEPDFWRIQITAHVPDTPPDVRNTGYFHVNPATNEISAEPGFGADLASRCGL